MSLSAISSTIANQTQQTVALASSLQTAQSVLGLLEAGKANLDALSSQIQPPTLDGTGQRIDRQV